MSDIEDILLSIKAALETQDYDFERNTGVPAEVKEHGLVIMRDGDPGIPERVLGGFETSYYSHSVELELYVQSGLDEVREQRYRDIVQKVRSALYSDKTFGGLIFGFETSHPEVSTITTDGAPIKAGQLNLLIEYELNNPLS